MKIPSYWEIDTEKSTSPYNLVDITLSSGLGRDICKIVQSTWKKNLIMFGQDAKGLTHASMRVTKVQRVENPELWQSYAMKRKHLGSRLSKSGTPSRVDVKTSGTDLDVHLKEDINEVYLFHGTKKKLLGGIINHGVDFRLSRDKPLFGRGAYFAESTTKADQYAGKVRFPFS